MHLKLILRFNNNLLSIDLKKLLDRIYNNKTNNKVTKQI
jgi:hypothetical protein